MNSTNKGRDFEQRVFEHVNRLLREGRLGLNPACCHVYLRKKYHSRDRGPEGQIETDVSVEVFREGQTQYSLLWVWECKDYLLSRVPIHDIEEFHAKLEQLGADRTKGTVVSSSGFQDGADVYARYKGIGLDVLPPDGPPKTIFPRMNLLFPTDLGNNAGDSR